MRHKAQPCGSFLCKKNSTVTRFYTLLIAFFTVFNGGYAQTALLEVPANNASELPEEKETGTVQGHIQTNDNQPAAYVTVTLKEANRSTITDENGVYTIRKIKPGQYTLLVTMAGLQSKEQAITVKRNEISEVNFALFENRKQLEEVVVTNRKHLNDQPVSIGKITIDPMDLPQSLSVIGHGLIREQQALRLSDVIRNVNGVYVTTTRGNVQESFGARGYSLGNTNLFKNGFRVNSGVMPEMSAL